MVVLNPDDDVFESRLLIIISINIGEFSTLNTRRILDLSGVKIQNINRICIVMGGPKRSNTRLLVTH